MSDLDKILHKRLARIQDELNFYISHRNHDQSVHTLPDPTIEDTSEEPILGDVQDKFLQSMKLVEEDFNEPSEKQECRRDIDKVLRRKGESFSEMLLRLIDEKGLKDSEAYKRANVDRRLFSKIRSSKEYMPSKKTAISFCLALQLDMEETQKLLGTAGYTLSTASRFDLIIMYLIENCEYNIHFANIVLDDYGEGTLSR